MNTSVNIFIGQDYIKINATKKIGNKQNVCIFNSIQNELNLIKSQMIIQESIKKIEKMCQQRIEKINLILDDFSIDSKNFIIDTKIIEETNEFKNFIELSESTLNNLKTSVLNKLDNQNNKNKLFSLIPFKFFVNSDTKNNLTYSTFPFGIKASKIKCLFSVRYIDSMMYSKLLEIFSNVNIKFENIILLSQLSIFKNENFSGSQKMNFTFDIQNKKSLLITSINDVVIATDKLEFSYNDLIEKISKNFDITIDEATNIVSYYGKINVNENEKNEIIHLSNNGNKNITRGLLAGVIKSFLKTLATNINDIIRNKTNDLNIEYQMNIVGKLENIDDINTYCAKYIGNSQKISPNLKQKNNFFNKSYEYLKILFDFLEAIENKISNKYVNQNNYVRFVSQQQNLRKQNFFKTPKKRVQQNPILA